MGKSKSRKYYAVCGGKDGFNGVLESWNECKEKVHGVSSVKYKSFGSRQLAESFVQSGKPLPLPPLHSAVSKFKSQCLTPVSSHMTVAQLMAENVALKEALRKCSVQKSGKSSVKDGKSSVQPKSFKERFGDLPDKILRPENSLVVFTDGACKNNGRRGARAGYGVFFGKGHEHNISQRLLGHATNQRAEMFAVIVAMQTAIENDLVPPGKGLLVMTDSQYTLRGLHSWVQGWKMRGWVTSEGTPVKNKDLWVKLDRWKTWLERNGIEFDIQFVKGHRGNRGNENADRLAVAGLSKPFPMSCPY